MKLVKKLKKNRKKKVNVKSFCHENDIKLFDLQINKGLLFMTESIKLLSSHFLF